MYSTGKMIIARGSKRSYRLPPCPEWVVSRLRQWKQSRQPRYQAPVGVVGVVVVVDVVLWQQQVMVLARLQLILDNNVSRLALNRR